MSRRVWGWPLALGLASGVGLVTALLVDGAWIDGASAGALALPLVVAARCIGRRGDRLPAEETRMKDRIRNAVEIVVFVALVALIWNAIPVRAQHRVDCAARDGIDRARCERHGRMCAQSEEQRLVENIRRADAGDSARCASRRRPHATTTPRSPRPSDGPRRRCPTSRRWSTPGLAKVGFLSEPEE